MTGKLAGYANSCVFLKREFQTVRFHGIDAWGLMDTYAGQRREKYGPKCPRERAPWKSSDTSCSSCILVRTEVADANITSSRASLMVKTGEREKQNRAMSNQIYIGKTEVHRRVVLSVCMGVTSVYGGTEGEKWNLPYNLSLQCPLAF